MRHAAVLVMLVASPMISPAPGPPVANAVSAVRSAPATWTDVCTVDDARAVELSGLVATASGFVVINDSQFDAAAMQIFSLNRRCDVTRTVRYPTPARDPEDLAVAPDGSLWVADTGDNVTNESPRQTIALWRLPAGGGAPVIHRLTYPDGRHDAEALLFTADGAPVVITKELNGTAVLYAPALPLQPRTVAGVALTRVGAFTPPGSGGDLLGAMVTGAATAPDRSRVALRTYTAAYEWDVSRGDVVKAITTGTPRVTPLPGEPQGEAIAYTSDGRAFLTVSDEAGPATIRSYPPGTQTVASRSAVPSSAPRASPPTTRARPSWLSSFSLSYGVAAAMIGLLLAGAGFIGLRGRRRRAGGRRPPT